MTQRRQQAHQTSACKSNPGKGRKQGQEGGRGERGAASSEATLLLLSDKVGGMKEEEWGRGSWVLCSPDRWWRAELGYFLQS